MLSLRIFRNKINNSIMKYSFTNHNNNNNKYNYKINNKYKDKVNNKYNLKIINKYNYKLRNHISHNHYHNKCIFSRNNQQYHQNYHQIR